MKTIFTFITIVSVQVLFSQNMSKTETINYINNNLSRNSISVDEQGYISISRVGKFHYSDIELGWYPFSTFQVQFKCINNIECIDNPNYNTSYETRYSNLARLFFDDKEQYRRVLNAFDYLFKKLRSENARKSNNDPFSPENYRK